MEALSSLLATGVIESAVKITNAKMSRAFIKLTKRPGFKRRYQISDVQVKRSQENRVEKLWAASGSPEAYDRSEWVLTLLTLMTQKLNTSGVSKVALGLMPLTVFLQKSNSTRVGLLEHDEVTI